MSSIPLSARDGDDNAPTPYGHGTAVPERLETDPLDKIVDDAAEKITSRGSGPQFDNLDKGLSDAMNRSEADRAELEDFAKVRGSRQELIERTGAKSYAEALKYFVSLHGNFQRDPLGTADWLAGQTLRHAPAADSIAKRDNTKPDPLASVKDAHPGVQLDAVIGSALEAANEGDRDLKEFSESAEVRAELKKMFPGVPMSKLTEDLVRMVRDLQADPLGMSARLAAKYGAPVTQGQQFEAEQKAQMKQLESYGSAVIEQARTSGSFPHFEELRGDMIEVLNRPDFRGTNNAMQDLYRAYRIAELQVIHNRRVERQEAALEKAAKAAPVKSSGGLQVGGSSQSLDSTISDALGKRAA